MIKTSWKAHNDPNQTQLTRDDPRHFEKYKKRDHNRFI